MALHITPMRGIYTTAPATLTVAPGADVTFGRSGKCDLVVSLPEPFRHYVSRTHCRFYQDQGHWRVRRDGTSELLLWLDFGRNGLSTCHGLGADLMLPTLEGEIWLRPSGTSSEVRMRWELTDEPGEAASERTDTDDLVTALPSAMSELAGELPPRFVAFLLVLCHRLLLKLDGTTPTIDEIAKWMSSRRAEPIKVETVRKHYLGGLLDILTNHQHTRTHAQREEAKETVRHRTEFAVLAHDAVRLNLVTCDQLLYHLRLGVLPNFPDLKQSEGLRG